MGTGGERVVFWEQNKWLGLAQAKQKLERCRDPDPAREGLPFTTLDYVNDSRHYSYQSNSNYISGKNSYESMF